MVESASNQRLGVYKTQTIGQEPYKAFIPPPLPPKPPLDMGKLYPALDKATKALGSIDALAELLPDTDLFLFMYARKEALTSSQIEGTQSSLSDLLLFEENELTAVEIDDVEEVSNYVAALNWAMEQLKKDLPICVRLITGMHGILLQGVRGSNKMPGEFRREQNWIGGTKPSKARFVPPPPEMVTQLIGDLEKFANNDAKLPALIKAALVHVQFETIHPFLDGNGRLGRLLITLQLCADGFLVAPILYLSLYFKENRDTYYDLLQTVRMKGDWEAWCLFFLEGVAETAHRAASDARKIIDLLERDRQRISEIGRAAKSALRIHQYSLKRPFVSITKASALLDLSVPATTNAINKLVEIGLLEEVTGQARNRLFAYTEYLAILSVGTEPLDS